MRQDFDRDYIEHELKKIGKVSQPIDFYMLGGGAMSIKGLKAATKDVDGVLKNSQEFRMLKKILIDSGYFQVKARGAYDKMKTRLVLQNDDGFRFDLFLKKIANGLLLSKGMMSRAKSVFSSGNLNVHVMSAEDIFILKSITSRIRDREDMRELYTHGLDFDVIKDEIIWQSDNSTRKAWLSYFFVGLNEFVERYGFEVPYYSEFEELASEEVLKYRIFTLLESGNLKVKELVAEISEDKEWIRSVLQKMEKEGKIRIIDDEMICKIE